MGVQCTCLRGQKIKPAVRVSVLSTASGCKPCPTLNGEAIDTTSGEEGQVELDNSLPTPGEPSPGEVLPRDVKHIFDITFEKTPLGIVLTSSLDGSCAYVTNINEQKNEALNNGKLPKNSKLLRVNDEDVEFEKIYTILNVVTRDVKTLPLKLTFCHPDGLGDDEIPDPCPGRDYNKE